METTETRRIRNPSNGGPEAKPKLVVIMGPTGSGKSKLAVDLASHFPIEIINADSMQVYRGLDVLTNKLTIDEQKGVTHHLLGTVNPNVEFTAKDFRDSVIPIIDDILSRNCLPVIVGGTNYYIQALISPFLLDETSEGVDEDCVTTSPGDTYPSSNMECEDISDKYEHLRSIDPVAANRIHPNNHRKINQYLSLYSRSGVLPSELLQGKAAENWGRVDNFRYSCCFICMDSSLPVLDCYVEQRVDSMVDARLLDEVYDIFNLTADYTRGLLQAIGVREFETFLREYIGESKCVYGNCLDEARNEILKENMRAILSSSIESKQKTLLKEAIDQVKLNTRRLLRRQKRMITRLQKLFEWEIRFMDATESISSKSDVIWREQVVEPAVKIIQSFLNQEAKETPNCSGTKILQRELWTQFVCEACGNKVLRGAYEWEQHKQGRSHRKRISNLRKSQGFLLTGHQQHAIPG